MNAQQHVVSGLLGLGKLADRPQGLGIVLDRRLQHVAGGGLLDELAVAQHHDPVRHLGNHREVMGDVDRRSVELLDDVAHRGEDFDLGGDVEGGGGLVENDEIGPAGHRHRGHGALELPARYLVWVALADLVRIGEPQPPVEVARVGFGLLT